MVPEIVITSQLLSSFPPLSSVPHTIAPFASVSNVPVHEGRLSFKSFADIPPENVDVPVPVDLITPPVIVRPLLDDKPPPPTESPDDEKVEVPVTPDSRRSIPSVKVRPCEEARPAAKSPPPRVEVAEVFVVTNVEVPIHCGVPPVEIERIVPLEPAVLSAIAPAPEPYNMSPVVTAETSASRPPYSCFRVPVEEVKAFRVVGSVAPSPMRIAPSVVTAKGVIAPRPLPNITAPSVIEERPVPPLETVKGLSKWIVEEAFKGPVICRFPAKVEEELANKPEPKRAFPSACKVEEAFNEPSTHREPPMVEEAWANIPLPLPRMS